MEKPAKITHADVRAKLEPVINEKGITDYTLQIESGAAKGDNYVGLILRATIEGLDRNGTTVTLNWIVKRAPKKFRAMMKIEKVYEREIYIYETLLPIFREFQVQKQIGDIFDDYPIFVSCYKEPPHETLIMCDMKSRGYVMKDKRLPLDVHHVRLGVKAYAKLHAVSYAMRRQRSSDFDVIVGNTRDFLLSDPNLEAFAPHQVALNEKALGTLDPVEDAYYMGKFRRFVDVPFDVVTRELLKAQDGRYSVVTHGDSWVNNMLFLYDNKDHPEVPTKICILDWQNARCGSPAFDLSYFLFTCTDKAFRDLHYHSMMKLYYYTLCMNLTELGSDPEQCLPYDVFQNELKRYSILGVTVSIMVLNMMLSDVGEIPDMGPDSVESLVNFKTKNEGAYKERVRGVIVNAIEYGYFDFLQ